ncbi:YlbF family regulator [Melissococcus plutonius]|nr:YlbF family regulator [Melissococcus plutonius]
MNHMIITNQLFNIEDQITQLSSAITTSNKMKNYHQAYQKMNTSSIVLKKRQAFLNSRESFEAIKNYDHYVPDYYKKKRDVHKAKRELDILPEVATFRQAELEIQTILDVIGTQIANTISQTIHVDTGNPFFEGKKKANCGGSCHGC